MAYSMRLPCWNALCCTWPSQACLHADAGGSMLSTISIMIGSSWDVGLQQVGHRGIGNQTWSELVVDLACMHTAAVPMPRITGVLCHVMLCAAARGSGPVLYVPGLCCVCAGAGSIGQAPG